MAYVPTNQDDEEERRTSAGAPPGQFGDTTPTSTQTKTDFVNVSDYLTKNPNASENLGNLASGKLEAQRDETQSAIQGAQSGFGQQVQSGTTNLDQGLLDSAFGSPDTFVQDSDQLSKFLAMRDATYKGPGSLQQTDVFAPTQSKVTALQQTGEGLGTEAGRTKLVEGLSTNPTHGKSALNQLLLQGNQGAAQHISDTAGTFGAVADQWNQFVQNAPGQVSTAQNTTNATRDATRAGLKQATDQFSQGLDQQLKSKTAERDAFNSQYTNINNQLNQYSGTNLRPADLEAIGAKDAFPYLSKLNEFNQYMGEFGSPVNLGNYAGGGRADSNIPTLAGVATQDQYAREAALQQMSGNDLGLPDQMGEMYRSNGQMPTLNYMDAFNAGGSGLQAADRSLLGAYGVNIDPSIADGGLYGWTPRPGSDSDTIAGLRQSEAALDRLRTPDYYTSPNAGATPLPNFPTTPAPEGWDASQPAPYPRPTSQPPSNLINPMWNPYTGQWQGAQLQPNNPPPSDGGGKIYYGMGV